VRIALVTEYYFPHLGGVTEHVHNLARRFRSAGHAVTVITSRMRGASVPEDSVCRVGRSVTLFSNGSFSRITVGTRLQTELRDQLRRDRIDVVHVHGPLAPVLGLAAPAAAHRLGIPVVGTFHSWFKSAAAYRLFRKPLQSRLDRMAATIAVSEPVVQAMSRYFRADWEIIPNGVCLDTFHPNGRPPVDGPLDNPRLLFLGRLDPRNGLDTLIRSMPRVLEAYPKAELIVVGDGPLRGYYERRARGLGPSIRFVGGAYGERPEYYGNVDLYLCPTNKG
jgi:phosphatidylinositol alpha-mannosyltransferase